MAWCIDTLKIVGEGKVLKSTLCNFELDFGYCNNFLLINQDYGEVLNVIVFPEKIFEKKFFGEDSKIQSMHFLKYKEGLPYSIGEKDIELIAKEYTKRSGKKLQLIQEI